VRNVCVRTGFSLGGGGGDVSYFVARVPRCYCHRKSGGGRLEKKARCVIRESLEASRVPMLIARTLALWVVASLSSS